MNEKWKEILSLAFYMLNEGNTINGCDIWFDKNYSYLDKVVNSQRASEIFSSISIEERIDFFKLWRSVCHDKEFIVYDVTSLSSYTRNMNIFEYGYNRDGDNLPQINMALFYGETSELPIFYNVYNGSITDKADLINVMRYTDLLEMSTTRYVMDRGFYSKGNISYFISNNKKFIMAVENRLSFVHDIITKIKTTITNQENRIDSFSLYGCKEKYINSKNKKQNLDVYIYFSYERKELESKQQERKIVKMEKELAALEDYSEERLKPYKKYFNTNVENNKLTYERDYKKINEENSYNGFFSFISNDETITMATLLIIYKKRGYAEQSFDNLKNGIDMKKLKTHKESTTEGKIFVAFISLIYKSYIGKKLKEYNINYSESGDRKSMTNLSSFSPQLLLKELAKIQITNIFGKTSLFKTISKKQKDILKIFNISEETINKDLN